jgi:hypothetical protein
MDIIYRLLMIQRFKIVNYAMKYVKYVNKQQIIVLNVNI